MSGFVGWRVFNSELKMTDSQHLLADYVTNDSEAAFRELVKRYVDLVYSTAIRLVGGDPHLSEDVTQTVFVDLARKARTLPRDVALGGWLHRDTCFVAAKTMRGERRRQFRERRAVEMNAQQDHSEANLCGIALILDDAINQLGEADRTAIVLRFYERLDFQSVGQALGSNETAAQKRVSRALEKLHKLLNNRGITFSAAALGAALASEAVSAAPAGLAIGISSAALASVAVGGTTVTSLNLITATNLKLGVISALVITGAATPWLIQHQSEIKQREEIRALQQHSHELGQQRAENERLSQFLAQPGSPLSNDQLRELLKLRSEVGLLRKATNGLPKLRAENRQLRSRLATVRAQGKPNLAAGDLVPIASLMFAGYATPEATLQSTLAAFSKGDVKYLDGFTPERRQKEQEDFTGKSESEIAAIVANQSAKLAETSLQILNSQLVSDDETELTLLSTADERLRTVTMKKIGGEWKISTD